MERRRHSRNPLARSHFRSALKWRCWGVLALAGIASASADLQGAVRVGNSMVPGADVGRAILECSDDSPDENRLACLKRVWFPRWQLNAHIVTEAKLNSSLERYEENDLLHRALVEKIQTNTAPASASEVDAYLRKHQRDFEKPLRLRLFRILVASPSEAKEVLAELGSPVSIETFRKIARAHSLDTATHERGGDLGFVWPDGSTDIPQVSAEPVLYQAALALEDGQLVKEPVAEGERFAVLWRRGSLAAEESNEEARQIAALRIQEAKADRAINELLAKNREQVAEKATLLLGFLRRPGTKLFESR